MWMHLAIQADLAVCWFLVGMACYERWLQDSNRH